MKISEKEIYLNSKTVEKVTDNERLNYALHYAKAGFKIFPLHYPIITEGERDTFVRCSCRMGKDCDAVGKHPRGLRFLFGEATTDESQISKWWNKYPNANIGALTGRESGIFVLDIDIKYGGEYSLEEIQDYYKNKQKDTYDFERTLTAYTGSGGRHLFFKHPSKFRINSSTAKIDDGLDIKGENSYIILPPSLHKCGRNYEWLGVETPIIEPPDWLLHEIIKAKKETVKSSTRKTYSSYQDLSGRNDYIFRQARGLMNTFPEPEISRRIAIKNSELVEALDEAEIRKIIDGTIKRYKNQNKDSGLKK